MKKLKKSSIDPVSLLPLTPAMFHILLSLSDTERHGYGIIKEVETSTANKVRLGPGTLYGLIKKLLNDGLIEESEERPDPKLDDDRRRYYRLTEFGRQVAVAEAGRLSDMVNIALAKHILPRPKAG